MRVWGPAAVGLGVVPALPYLFDHPVENAVDRLWEKVDEIVPEKYSTKNVRVTHHAPHAVVEAEKAIVAAEKKVREVEKKIQ